MSIMGQRTAPRGTPGTWDEQGAASGPEGSNLFAAFYANSVEECADVEEQIGRTKRRLCRIVGPGAHARAVAWMDGFWAGLEHSKKAPIVETTRNKGGKPRRPK